MMCWTSTTDWDWLMPYAQASIGRKEYAEASTILTGMLNNIRSVDERRRKTARSMVGHAFSRMGAVGLEIDADSPIAPLMQISLYLRLGDKELALSSYTRYRDLFDEHQNELPIELVAFAVNTHIVAGGKITRIGQRISCASGLSSMARRRAFRMRIRRGSSCYSVEITMRQVVTR